jgi:tRNA threonylcarbamoyladenosine biosynthesis protein TsaE
VRFIAETAEETKAFARRLAEKLVGGELLLLEGDLGAGKTTFVQGLAEGLGAEVGASSPTFVLERRYPGRFELIHLDLYRMEDEREAALLVGEALRPRRW